MRLFTFLALALAAPAWSIEVRVASATVPPGGSIQLQLAPTNPQPILGSGNALEFSSSDFTSVDGIALFSPAGDAAGTAIVTARGVMIRAVSPQGSFGTGSYPMLTAVARTNPAASIGSKSTVTINPGLSFWQDLFGQNYPATTKPGTITFGGSAWISNIVPGGGPLPAGHSVKILGGGFSPGTAVAIDGVTIASKRFVNPNEIEVTLGEAADLTSARVLLKNPDNFQVTYYSYLRAAALGASARPLIASTRPIFQNLYKSGAYLAPAASGVTALAMQNANTRSVDVTLDLVDASGISQAQVVVTLPSGFRWTRELSEIFGGAAIPAGGGVKASSDTAIQFLGVNADEAAGTAVPMIPLASQPVTNMLSANPASLTFDYTIGGANPPPQGIAVTSILGKVQGVKHLFGSVLTRRPPTRESPRVWTPLLKPFFLTRAAT